MYSSPYSIVLKITFCNPPQVTFKSVSPQPETEVKEKYGEECREWKYQAAFILQTKDKYSFRSGKYTSLYLISFVDITLVLQM